MRLVLAGVNRESAGVPFVRYRQNVTANGLHDQHFARFCKPAWRVVVFAIVVNRLQQPYSTADA
jgi:hypothetical protein